MGNKILLKLDKGYIEEEAKILSTKRSLGLDKRNPLAKKTESKEITRNKNLKESTFILIG